MSDIESQSYFPTEQFRQVSGPVLDIRSPAEFNQGHFPGAINLPLFNDEERATVGKSYKKESRLKAIFKALKATLPNTSKLLKIINKTATKSGGINKSLRIYICYSIYLIIIFIFCSIFFHIQIIV